MSTLINSFWVVIPSEITLTSTSVLVSWSPTNIVNSGTTLDWTVSGGVTIAKTTIDDPTFDFSSNTGTANVLIENVEDLTTFDVTGLNITTLNLSGATSLNILNTTNNLALTSIVFPTGASLTDINATANSLTSIDISTNTALINLRLTNNNSVTIIDVSTNILLELLLIDGNSLTSINVSTNVVLTELRCNDNTLSTLDISTNILLAFLRCQENSFSASVTNQILADLVAAGLSNGTLHYRNNETGQGVTDRATLITRGWAITNYGT